MNTYTIHTFTGNVAKASSDANVHIILVGDRGDSGTHMLDHPKGLFARGKKDSFEVECRNVGKIRKVKIGELSLKRVKFATGVSWPYKVKFA